MNSRREFLAMLAGGLAAAGSPLVSFQRAGATQRIVILGGGLAGLTAAYELQRLGHDVTVLEAQTRPGGRVKTIRDPYPNGLYTEAGAENIPAVHDLTQYYAREMGLTLLPNSVPGMRSLYHVRDRRVLAAESPVWPFDLTAEERALGLNGLFTKYVEAASQEALAAGWATAPVKTMLPWDGMTPGAWLKSKGASPAAAELMTLGFGLEFGSAASFLLHGINSRGAGVNYRIEGGNDRLPRAIAARVRVRYGTPVERVTQDDYRVTIRMRTAGGTETVAADRVICALPCPVIGSILADAKVSDEKARAIREQHYSRTVKVFMQTRSRFWLRDRFSGYATTDLPIERLTPDPGADAGSRGALAAYPIAGYANTLEGMSESARVQAAFDQARQIFPELAKEFEGGVSHAWGAEPWQRGAFALHTPGQIGFIDVLAKPEGRVHFAGEHTSPWTGWMQGAFESARRVVREISS
jgi:monoamine oxidase